ncbi:hypothetical protein PS9374_04521 [Planomonospora sphaerica]|uniref:Recombinase family protein n=2 Tax=Planomonospora sphaerica TaxID=161355 RepID=A0A171DJ16_9ACTN|nr:hypothetical protein PS9374_04521 [Planomonospora sphaerica]
MIMDFLTEQLPVPGPVVYGYLRPMHASIVRVRALREALAEYCHQHELSLAGVFTERSPASPAFTGLLDALALPGSYGVVVPALSHLGPRATAQERRKEIVQRGARLLLVRGADRSVGTHGGQLLRRIEPAAAAEVDA